MNDDVETVNFYYPKHNVGFTDYNSITTKVISISYADRHFVSISQIGKIGTLIHAWSEKSNSTNKYIYQNKILFGRRDDLLLEIYSRQIIEMISKVSDKPLLLAISLDKNGRDTLTLQNVLNKLIEIATWN